MSQEATPDLSPIMHQIERLADDIGGLKDDMRVMVALVRRLDGTVSRLVREMREVGANPCRS